MVQWFWVSSSKFQVSSFRGQTFKLLRSALATLRSAKNFLNSHFEPAKVHKIFEAEGKFPIFLSRTSHFSTFHRSISPLTRVRCLVLGGFKFQGGGRLVSSFRFQVSRGFRGQVVECSLGLWEDLSSHLWWWHIPLYINYAPSEK